MKKTSIKILSFIMSIIISFGILLFLLPFFNKQIINESLPVLIVIGLSIIVTITYYLVRKVLMSQNGVDVEENSRDKKIVIIGKVYILITTLIMSFALWVIFALMSWGGGFIEIYQWIIIFLPIAIYLLLLKPKVNKKLIYFIKWILFVVITFFLLIFIGTKFYL